MTKCRKLNISDAFKLLWLLGATHEVVTCNYFTTEGCVVVNKDDDDDHDNSDWRQLQQQADCLYEFYSSSDYIVVNNCELSTNKYLDKKVINSGSDME
jgi:hypothetical protein